MPHIPHYTPEQEQIGTIVLLTIIASIFFYVAITALRIVLQQNREKRIE